MYQISKTEAVNRIIKPLGGTRISDLDTAQNDEILNAIYELDATVEKIQWENEWNFNSDGQRTLIPNGDGIIETPSYYSFLKILKWTDGHPSNLTTKGAKLYNLRENTDQITGEVTVMGTRIYTYDELPGVIQNYAVEKAKYHYVGNNTHLSGSRIALTVEDMKQAFQAAIKYDSELRLGIIDPYPGQRQQLRGRSPNPWWDGGCGACEVLTWYAILAASILFFAVIFGGLR